MVCCRMAVTLCVGLNLEMYQLHIVVLVMTNLEKSLKSVMTICYLCDLSLFLPLVVVTQAGVAQLLSPSSFF